MQPMFLRETTKNLIMSVVAKTKTRMSTDSDGLDLKIVKMTIDYF